MGDAMRHLIAVAMLALPGCISVSDTTRLAAPACQVGEPMVETALFLGLARPGGSVSRFEFNRFVEQEVASRWKEGFTILEGQGMWLSERSGVAEHEPSRVLIRIHDGGTAASTGIEDIRNAYIKTFDQEAVLRTDRATCADF